MFVQQFLWRGISCFSRNYLSRVSLTFLSRVLLWSFKSLALIKIWDEAMLFTWLVYSLLKSNRAATPLTFTLCTRPFPVVNQYPLLVKQIKRNCPLALLNWVEDWFSRSSLRVKRDNLFLTVSTQNWRKSRLSPSPCTNCCLHKRCNVYSSGLCINLYSTYNCLRSIYGLRWWHPPDAGLVLICSTSSTEFSTNYLGCTSIWIPIIAVFALSPGLMST